MAKSHHFSFPLSIKYRPKWDIRMFATYKFEYINILNQGIERKKQNKTKTASASEHGRHVEEKTQNKNHS